MQSGRCPVGTVPMTLSVFRSTMLTVLSRPLLVKPRPSLGARAMPWTPFVPGMSPRDAPESASSTMTCVPRLM